MEILDTKDIQVEGEKLFNSDNYTQLEVWDKKKWVAVDDLLKLKDKIRKTLIHNTGCDCLISTTKYADIVDVLLWFEIENKIKKTEGGRHSSQH